MTSRIVAMSSAITLVEASADPAAPGLPRFSMAAYNGGAMRLGGWRHPVVVDLAGMKIPYQKRPIRAQHDPALGVGHTDRIAVEDSRLVAEGVISRRTAIADDIVASSKAGFPWQASIGASVEKHDFVREGETVTVNGREFPGPINVVRASTLGEISFVDLGADDTTTATIAASAAQENDMDLAARAAALTAKHPDHAAEIHAALIAGKADEDISAELEAAAEAARLAAERSAAEAIKAERDAAVAELAALKGQVEAKDAEIAALKAAAAHRANIPGDPGDLEGGSLPAGTWTKDQFAAASPAERLRFQRAGGTVLPK